jgi:hypothetical protein
MILLQAAKEDFAQEASDQYRSLSRVVSYPISSTGTNYNLVDKVEHDLRDRVVWHIIHSPDGTFVTERKATSFPN